MRRHEGCTVEGRRANLATRLELSRANAEKNVEEAQRAYRNARYALVTATADKIRAEHAVAEAKAKLDTAIDMTLPVGEA